MSQVEDTQLKEAIYAPGALVDEGKWRIEFDSMGQVKVPADRLWGAQTQRSLIHFSIGNDRMPIELYHAYGYVKKSAAIVNQRLGHLPNDKAELIIEVADEVCRRQARRQLSFICMADRQRHAKQHECE
jgi:fumarate hydratase, class II